MYSIVFRMSMEFNETNSSNLDTILIGLGIAHLILVWIPAVLLGTIALFFIFKLIKMKSTLQNNSTIFLYFIMVSISVAGPSTYGLLWDISLILGVPEICALYPSGLAGTLGFIIFHTLLSSVIGLVAVLQFLILKYGQRLTIRATIMALIIVTIASLIIPSAVIFNEYNIIEIRGTQCGSDPDTTLIHFAILLIFGYLPPLVITIAATVTTHCKLKRSVLDQNKSKIVRSVLAINLFNIVQFNLFRAAAILMFYIGTSVAPNDDITMYKLLTVVGRYVADLSYPVTICSILMVHKSLRSMLLACLKRILGIKTTPKKLRHELSKSTALTIVSLNEQQVKMEKQM